ncbi:MULTISPECIES: glutathione-independent formaldehyde dehydrogenase [Micromonospora]|uniref:glutathione-independent formaldehyde dehydrogenase n=1 Tax=Micromonospora TaxID=1873 RepID=UPI0013B64113|nr:MULTISPECIES: glutathione-independent formaldehyde dehydrogenase [Micromonospora]NES13210.1 alcohol dehydrogenase catalytic domain-containing protein [Micromonospora sp. PPF5-17B]NES34579.1 alcohol dehydrogenase catalytic domain-containing protein [Micromonospora solifontis]NES57057.1 alcohol dehydrogenase catalytic domain-containing protein [Micromonospora sp. PPF5-6]
MKAVVYQGPHDVAVNEVEDPRIEDPNDVIVKITTTAICGSDLHMYEGRTTAEPGIVFGHENMGVIVETGPGVVSLRKGDRVSMPFNVACGFCRNCREGKTGFCLTVNPGFAGGAYGYVSMGPYRGGQAEYLRVPFADFNCLKLPPGPEHENDFAMLADIFPTGYHGVAMTGLRPGENITVMGGGPVGLMAAYSALLMGAAEVFVVDRVPDRLRLAESIGATPVDFTKGDPVEQIKERTDGVGTDKGVDAVGYQASAPSGEEQPARVLNSLIDVVRPTGAIGVVGLYLAEDPGAPDEHSARGELLVKMGKLFEKGLRMGTGQANVKAYNEYLRNLIVAGRAEPGFVVSKELPLDAAPEAYQHFDRREPGYSKVVLKPGG